MNITETLLEMFPRGGYFVEAGAHDGIGDSQTYALEQTGLWDGLCVEPSSAYHGLQKNRKCKTDNRCLWETDLEDLNFCEVQGNAIELSGVEATFRDHWDRKSRPNKTVVKLSVSLPTLLKQHKAPKVIEFFSLDTEGSEHEILRGHDFSQHQFLTMLVEHNNVKNQQQQIQGLLTSKGMQLRYTDETNDWYVDPNWRTNGTV